MQIDRDRLTSLYIHIIDVTYIHIYIDGIVLNTYSNSIQKMATKTEDSSGFMGNPPYRRLNDGPKITLRYAKKLLRIGSGFDAKTAMLILWG